MYRKCYLERVLGTGLYIDILVPPEPFDALRESDCGGRVQLLVVLNLRPTKLPKFLPARAPRPSKSYAKNFMMQICLSE